MAEPEATQEEQEKQEEVGPILRAERETSVLFSSKEGQGEEEGIQVVNEWMDRHGIDSQDLFAAIGEDLEAATALAMRGTPGSPPGTMRPDVLWIMGFVVGVTYQRERDNAE